MATVVRMPTVMAGAREAALQSWLVAVGDRVVVGQPIAEIETEKAVFEQVAETSGTVAGLLVAVGESVPVGAPIAVLTDGGEDPAAALAAVPAAAGPSATPVAASGRIFASPLVRRLAHERGLDLVALQGSGPGGRIVRRDIDALAPGARSGAAGEVAPPAAEGWTDEPHSPMRRAIARRLTESTTTVPHFFVTADCRVDALLELRRVVNADRAEAISVSDLVVKAVAAALVAVPAANAVWTSDATRRFERADIGVAVAVDGGLLTPVIRGVDEMKLGDLSAAIRDVAARARSGRLHQHELEGGSFAVSNLGMHGIREFSAIINPPHSGILAVGAASKRPVVDEGGALAVATVMTVTLSADHRVLDGAVAAQWLTAFVGFVENPVRMLV